MDPTTHFAEHGDGVWGAGEWTLHTYLHAEPGYGGLQVQDGGRVGGGHQQISMYCFTFPVAWILGLLEPMVTT
jgi:hypothetical protein